MPRRLALAVLAAAGLPLSVRPAPAADAFFPSHDARISVNLGDDGRAVVSEEYALTAAIDMAAVQFLSDPCAIVGPVSGSIDNRAIGLTAVAEAHQPWILLLVDASGAPNGPGKSFALRYEVNTRGAEVAVPIVMPAATLESAEGTRGARVNVAVRWTGAAGAARIAMPRLEPTSSPNVWEARLLAIPSSVRVEASSAVGRETCDRTLSGTTGGLEWRFLVFVGTMVIWVPAYLLWFGRRWTPTS